MVNSPATSSSQGCPELQQVREGSERGEVAEGDVEPFAVVGGQPRQQSWEQAVGSHLRLIILNADTDRSCPRTDSTAPILSPTLDHWRAVGEECSIPPPVRPSAQVLCKYLQHCKANKSRPLQYLQFPVKKHLIRPMAGWRPESKAAARRLAADWRTGRSRPASRSYLSPRATQHCWRLSPDSMPRLWRRR